MQLTYTHKVLAQYMLTGGKSQSKVLLCFLAIPFIVNCDAYKFNEVMIVIVKSSACVHLKVYVYCSYEA